MPRTGRPELDDDETLYAMTEVVFENRQIAIADVIRMVVVDFSHEQSEEAAIRRLRDKFNRRKHLLLATVMRDALERQFYLMSPERASFQPVPLIKVPEGLQLPSNLPEMQRASELITQFQNPSVSQEIHRMVEEATHFGERMQRAFKAPEIQRIRNTLEAASRSFNTPEMRRMIEQANKASEAIGRLSLQGFA